MDRAQFVTKSADERADSDADAHSDGSDGKGFDLVKNLKVFSAQLQKQLRAVKKDKKMLLSTIQKLEQSLVNKEWIITQLQEQNKVLESHASNQTGAGPKPAHEQV